MKKGKSVRKEIYKLNFKFELRNTCQEWTYVDCFKGDLHFTNYQGIYLHMKQSAFKSHQYATVNEILVKY